MRIIRELRELVSFIVSLWGILTLAGAFLPLANQMSHVLALPEGQVNIATGVASLTCLFAFLYSFAERHRLHNSSYRPPVVGFGGFDPDSNALRSALERFGLALALLTFYLMLNVLRGRLAAETGDVQQFVVSLMPPVLLVGYAALFGLLTAAFGELAVIEHVRGRESEDARQLARVESRR